MFGMGGAEPSWTVRMQELEQEANTAWAMYDALYADTNEQAQYVHQLEQQNMGFADTIRDLESTVEYLDSQLFELERRYDLENAGVDMRDYRNDTPPYDESYPCENDDVQARIEAWENAGEPDE